MVSLTRSFNTNSGGATFFNESENTADVEDVRPILDSFGRFKPLKTIPVFSVHLLGTLLTQILSFVFLLRKLQNSNQCTEYFTVIYTHAGLWLFTLIADQIVYRQHHKLRLLGYLDFYNKIYIRHRLPFYVISLWNTAILVVQGILHQFYTEEFNKICINRGLLSPLGYLCIFITLEFLIIAVVNISYIGSVLRFNKQKPPPDVQREEWNSCASADIEFGCSISGEKLEDFLQKQADLIRFLREHNARLGEKLIVLNAQNQARGSN